MEQDQDVSNGSGFVPLDPATKAFETVRQASITCIEAVSCNRTCFLNMPKDL